MNKMLERLAMLATNSRIELTLGELVDLRDAGFVGFKIGRKPGETKVWITKAGQVALNSATKLRAPEDAQLDAVFGKDNR